MGGPISAIYGSGKNGVVLGSVFRQKFVCCALTILYSIYNMVSRSIASIFDLGSIFTSVLRASINMSPWV